MSQDDPMAISRRLDELITTTREALPALREIVAEHGLDRTVQDARIVFASWRSRIDHVEATLDEIVAQHRSGA